MGNECDLDPEISDDLKEVDFSDSPQFTESYINYLTHMSQKIEAIAKPVDDHLVIASDGSGKSVNGKSLPTKYFDASDFTSYSCNFRKTESNGFSGTVYASWYEKETGEYHLEKVGNGVPETELQEILRKT